MNNPAILEKRLYTASATSTGGRDGRVKTDDATLDLAIVMPKQLGGAGTAGATNPEQLFANVTIGQVGARFGLAVEISAAIPELPRDQAEALVAAAHEVCPYSNATRGNIVVDVRVA